MKCYARAAGLLLLILAGCKQENKEDPATVLDHATLIDGTGAPAQNDMTLIIQADTIYAIFPHGSMELLENSEVTDLEGKTIMPSMVNTHGHVGLLKGNKVAKENYTRENILRQLEQYEQYGVGAVLSLGSDREIMFALADSSQHGQLSGAMVFTAGYGIGVPKGAPPQNAGFDKVIRPMSAKEATEEMQQLVKSKPAFVKIWVDDFGGTVPKMEPEVYEAVIGEAHQHGLRVAAHVFYLEDAKKLVAAGVDILAHSIRDQEVDAELLQEMKAKNVVYIPTLSLDEYNFIYLRQPDWVDSKFFSSSLEPGVLDSLKSEDYLNRLKNDPNLQQKIDHFNIALNNLKKMYEAGIKVTMGTDSGAQPIRAQGFSEHLELQLMTEAGLTPLQAITIVTRNGAELLKIDDEYGTLQIGKKANFVVLGGNPVEDIKNTRNIVAVWADGEKVSGAPGDQ
ncbi:amidohydrolase family protein [Pontibacter silvestris]|uniref:Amidohydrolase family protein n=1 Tax=Pontibacter silvestris TaxID=2305183 RepID=A0ABW4X0K0_9BACT|nr:amidohydrolase family protein [Pontibacter silvestris]MCC9138885.1 amidohydrolase family protein [Pontibacter silvestris]